MQAPDDIVFLLDCDNTLLDNDRVQADLRAHLESEFGARQPRPLLGNPRGAARGAGLHGLPGRVAALPPRRNERSAPAADVLVSRDYPFAERLYPGALEAIAHLRSWGPTVVLSDGDVVFQPRKVQRSGLWEAVEGRVLIYIHKEQMLDDVGQRYPASHYVMVDDKLPILAAMKEAWGRRLTSILPRQGHYALDPEILAAYPPADITVERIGELVHFDLPTLSGKHHEDNPTTA
jgi:FMN phosphatase YigB (HAD superfamily)